MKYAFIESTEDFVAGPYRVRVWREEQEVAEGYDNHDIFDTAANLVLRYSRSEIVKAIAALPRVNAVEVKSLGEREHGVVIYNNW